MSLIFYNGTIRDTLDFNCFEALGIDKGSIVARGSLEQVKSALPKAKLVDLKKHVLMPAFNDSHMHLLGYGQSLFQVELSGADSMEALIEKASSFIQEKALEKGQWLMGRGWNQDKFKNPKLPTRHELDQISTTHPIFLRRACGHIGVANSLALSLTGLLIEKPTVFEGGAIDLDEEGIPLGILRENAMNQLLDQVPTPDDSVLASYIKAAEAQLFSGGITSVQSDDLCVFPEKDSSRILRLFEAMGEDGRLKISVHEQSLMRHSAHLKYQLEMGYNYLSEFGTFSHGPLKILGDGSLGARTAFLNEPYSDDPSTRGIAMYSQEELNHYVELAFIAGMSVAIHGIGDAMIDMAIHAIQYAKAKLDAVDNQFYSKLRNAIVHCQITTREQLYLMRDLNIIGMVQPVFIDYDRHIVPSRVGSIRMAETYAFKTMEVLGIPTCYGTDCPVEDYSVFRGLRCAVTRKDLSGSPQEPFIESEAVTIEEALRAYTLGGAYASFEEKEKGGLLPGMTADLVILDRDPLHCPAEALTQIKVLQTYKTGELVYTWRK